MNCPSHIILVFILLLTLFGCHHPSEKDEVALTDSVLAQNETLLLNNPQNAYPILASLQKELTGYAVRFGVAPEGTDFGGLVRTL